MTEANAIIPGAEPWASAGEGARARIGIGLIHGFSGNPIAMRPLAEGLARRGYRVELPRLPGHGTHWRDMATTRYDDWRAEVERVAHLLGHDCDAVVLAGLSLGGTLALDVACESPPQLRGVVAINATVLDRDGLLAKLAPLVSRVLPAIPAAAAGLVKNDVARPDVDERAYKWLPTAAARSVLTELPRVRKRLGGLRLPLLLACSKQDHSVPPDNTTAIAALVEAEVTILPLLRSYHVATLDYDRELLEERIAAFADSLA